MESIGGFSWTGSGKIQGGGWHGMESINEEDILLILKLLEESKFDDLCLETDCQETGEER